MLIHPGGFVLAGAANRQDPAAAAPAGGRSTRVSDSRGSSGGNIFGEVDSSSSQWPSGRRSGGARGASGPSAVGGLQQPVEPARKPTDRQGRAAELGANGVEDAQRERFEVYQAQRQRATMSERPF